MYPNRQAGFLVLRLGIGFMFMLHGWPKLAGGLEVWQKVGSAMSVFGLESGYGFFGFMAAFAETVGGLFIMLGFIFRPMVVLLFLTMAVASTRHLVQGDGFGVSSHAIEAAILFLSLYYIGPGRYSLDEKMFGNERTIR